MIDFIRERSRITLLENFNIYKNLAKLNFDTDKVLDAYDRFLGQRSQKKLTGFTGEDYNLSAILTDPHYLHKSSKYVMYLDYFVGKILKKHNNKKIKSIIKEGLLKNFAETGLTLSFFNFCLSKRIGVTDLEPFFYNKKLDMKLLYKNEEILLESYAPVSKVTESPVKLTIGSMVDYEVKNHELTRANIPIILLIMLNNSWWSGNHMIGGKISDFMFYPAKICIKLDDEEFDENVSAVILKRGNIFSLHLNKKAKFPLSKRFIKKITKHLYIIRVIELLKYLNVKISAKKRFLKILKKYPYEEAEMRRKGLIPKQVIQNYLDFTDRYHF